MARSAHAVSSEPGRLRRSKELNEVLPREISHTPQISDRRETRRRGYNQDTTKASMSEPSGLQRLHFKDWCLPTKLTIEILQGTDAFRPRNCISQVWATRNTLRCPAPCDMHPGLQRSRSLTAFPTGGPETPNFIQNCRPRESATNTSSETCLAGTRSNCTPLTPAEYASHDRAHRTTDTEQTHARPVDL